MKAQLCQYIKECAEKVKETIASKVDLTETDTAWMRGYYKALMEFLEVPNNIHNRMDRERDSAYREVLAAYHEEEKSRS